MQSHEFRFHLGDVVKLSGSDETGVVIARAEYQHSDDSYLVRYKAGDGRLNEQWWDVSALEK